MPFNDFRKFDIMKELLLEYEEYLRKENVAENTLSSYLRDAQAFLSYLKECRVKSALNVKKITIDAYVERLKDLGRANSTISRTVAALRKFYGFLQQSGKIDKNPVNTIDVPRVKKKVPEALTTREIVKLLNQPKPTDLKGIRDKAMLELLYATGIKVSEIITLTLRDVDLKGGMISCGSSRNERYIPIGKEAADALDEYIKTARGYMTKGKREKTLFVNCSGAPLTRQGFWKILRSYAQQAGIKTQINAQTLRNSFAVHLLQNGADINAVSEMLGHNDVVTTRVYNQVLKNNIKKIYKKAHPRA